MRWVWVKSGWVCGLYLLAFLTTNMGQNGMTVDCDLAYRTT